MNRIALALKFTLILILGGASAYASPADSVESRDAAWHPRYEIRVWDAETREWVAGFTNSEQLQQWIDSRSEWGDQAQWAEWNQADWNQVDWNQANWNWTD